MNTPTDVCERPIAIDDLDRAIVNLSAKINASTYELLVLIREFDERAGWLKWGFENCTQWLHWRCDLSRSAAREKVRVAHALKELPEIAGAFASGELSYSKVRPLTRVATPMNEASLLRFALSTTAARVEARCQQLRNALPGAVEGANRAHARRSVRVWRDQARGTLSLSVELPLEAGELVCQALDKAVEANGQKGPEFEQDLWGAQRGLFLPRLHPYPLRGCAPHPPLVQRGVRRAWRTRRFCAALTTVWSMKADTRSARTIEVNGISGAPMVEPFHRTAISPMTCSTSTSATGGTRNSEALPRGSA